MRYALALRRKAIATSFTAKYAGQPAYRVEEQINFKSTKLDLSIIIRDLYSSVLPRAKTLISEEMIVIMSCQG